MKIGRILALCADMWINVLLLFLVSLNLAIGAAYTFYGGKAFAPLNVLTIQNWFGPASGLQIDKLWWVVTLLVLLLFLGVTTMICVGREVGGLWSGRHAMGWRCFSVKICPALIHLCFVVLLLGHALSLVANERQSVDIRPGIRGLLPGQATFEVTGQAFDRYTAPGPLQGFLKNARVTLVLRSAAGDIKSREVAVLEPIHWNGMSLHLIPKKKQTGAGTSPAMTLVAQKDPGRALILAGFAVMILLMLWYYINEKN